MTGAHGAATAGAEVDRVFIFADLSGYTALTAAHGNATAADVVQRFVEIAAGALRGGASVLERVGDELVIVSTDAVSAVETAVALRQAVAQEPLFPEIRAGIHAGLVVEREGQYFGGALNVAARVTNHARPGQIICTPAVSGRAALPGVRYRPSGLVRLKNIPGAMPLFELMTEKDDEAIHVDPVCRMQIAATAVAATVVEGSTTYLFCSEACAAAFAARPTDYVGMDAEVRV